jgi:ABC-type proline/glycine betaine transport system permease subunit
MFQTPSADRPAAHALVAGPAVVAVAAHAAHGWKLSLFVVIAMLYVAASGYWNPTMKTLALVGESVRTVTEGMSA